MAGRWAWRDVGRGGTLGVAALKAGAAHPRRQKHREMPPPGASAPAFAATVEPTSTQITSCIPPTYLQSDSSNKRVLKMACCMHRFLISSPNLQIDVRFSPFKSSCVHRFLISRLNLGIDAGFCLFTPSCVHRFLILSPDLGIDAASSLLQLRTARLQHHRSCAEEQPACSTIVAAQKNGSPAE